MCVLTESAKHDLGTVILRTTISYSGTYDFHNHIQVLHFYMHPKNICCQLFCVYQALSYVCVNVVYKLSATEKSPNHS